MLFLTPWFVVFAVGAFAAYLLLPLPRVRLVLLLVTCVVFHTHFAGPAGVVPVVVVGIATYLAGLTRNKLACRAGIVLAVAALVFYKYTRFLCLDVLGGVWPYAGQHAFDRVGPLLPGMPPLAISFFVFEFVHYLYDVTRGRPPIRNPLHFGLFALFWPSIVAGPVKRYEQFLPAVQQGVRGVRRRDVAAGLLRVAVGLVKKIAADNLTAYIAFHDKQFNLIPLSTRWLVFLAIGLRILWDFSGYSDMAIGFARMHGIALPKNFNWPYLALSVPDFWHRWHISLSLWIRDYVYIPIGGGHCPAWRKAVNGLLAFAICGLWHGAAWNFLFWGLYHGVGLAISSNYRKAGGRWGEALHAWFARNELAARVLTFLFVHVGWLFFFYRLPVAWRMLKLLFRVEG